MHLITVVVRLRWETSPHCGWAIKTHFQNICVSVLNISNFMSRARVRGYPIHSLISQSGESVNKSPSHPYLDIAILQSILLILISGTDTWLKTLELHSITLTALVLDVCWDNLYSHIRKMALYSLLFDTEIMWVISLTLKQSILHQMF